MAERKVDKQRPYRVDYFEHHEMVDGKVVVRSLIIRAVTAAQAREYVNYDNMLNRTVIRAYRFYKALPKNTKVKYVSLDKLFSADKAAAVRKDIEWRSAGWVEKGGGTFFVTVPAKPAPTTGPESEATKAVVADLQGMVSNDQHEQFMDTFVPMNLPVGRHYLTESTDQYIAPLDKLDIEAAAPVLIPENLSFPDHAAVPTEVAVFDGEPDSSAETCSDSSCLYCNNPAADDTEGHVINIPGYWIGVGLVVAVLAVTYLYLCGCFK